MTREPSVLIVDRCEETREVLETALNRRGVHTYSASKSRQGLQLARQVHPSLIVLDLEVERSGSEQIYADYAEQSRTTCSPLVLLGSIRRRAGSSQQGEFVSKPYHYGPLIRRIEELLSRTERKAA